MIPDLEKVDVSKASQLKNAVENLSDHRITRRLQNPNSELCKSIPKDIFERDAAGRRYLDILSMIQPSLKPQKVAKLDKRTKSDKKCISGSVSSEMQLTNSLPMGSGNQEEMSDFVKMFSSNMDKDLLNLAENVRKDIDMSETELHEMMKSMDMQKMMSVFGKISSSMQQKIQTGQVDVNKLHNQAMSFVDNLQTTPEYNKVIQENPMLANIMKGDVPNLDNLGGLTAAMTAMGGEGDQDDMGGMLGGNSMLGGNGILGNISNLMSNLGVDLSNGNRETDATDATEQKDATERDATTTHVRLD